MKTRTCILLLGAMLFTSIAWATDLPKMTLTPVENGKAMLVYKATTAATLEITLSDYNDRVVFFTRTQNPKSELNHLLHFDKLENGTYCISVNYGNKSISRNVQLDKGNIVVGKTVCCYEPYFTLDDKMLGISFFNSSGKQVYATIYQNGSYVSGTKLGKQHAIQKRLDLSQLDAGKYEIVITDSSNEHRFFATL